MSYVKGVLWNVFIRLVILVVMVAMFWLVWYLDGVLFDKPLVTENVNQVTTVTPVEFNKYIELKKGSGR